ncbi:DUF4097 family beta strand repeat-containing protein [Fulvivirga lutimaris]|uniref:DUF4097 family beta strand repeat-containing protein n=1 Tax=Fulvivirga lutimaris TaxID=1819566 RepID=UPI0031B6075F
METRVYNNSLPGQSQNQKNNKKLNVKKMKKLKFIGLTCLAITLGLGQINAQNSNEYKLDMSSGKLIVKELDEVEFVASSNGSVVITNRDNDREKSERAKGLRLINGLGLEDNTGIGLNVEKTSGGATVSQISRNGSGEYIIKVPKGVTIVFENGSVYSKGVSFKNITSEIEVTTTHCDVRLDNVTGPMTVSTVHGDIDGAFSAVSQANPISIVSAHGDIDLGIPSGTKANFTISTNWGEIYSDLDIEIEKNAESMKRYNQNKVNGKMSGGGVSMNISSTHGSIYLRKK